MSTTLTLQQSDTAATGGDRPAAGRFYQPELDALRFLAFLLVFGRHVFSAFGLAQQHQYSPDVPLPGSMQPVAHTASHVVYHLSPAWRVVQGIAQSCDFGVCLFFFLSSFLITRLLLIERKSTGTVAMKDFYIRRMLRIWPLYFVFIAFVLMLSIWIPSIRPGWGRVVASIFFVANWPIVLHGFVGNPIEPLWSISVEEQFYLVWPSFARLGRKYIIAISVILMAAAIAALAYYGSRAGTVNSNLWPNSLIQSIFFAGGALTATWGQPEKVRWKAPARVLLFLAGFASWFFASGVCHVVRAEGPGAARLVLGYISILLGTFLIFTAFAGAPARLFPRSVLYLGRISYGLYVFHVLSLALTLRVAFSLFSQGVLSSTAVAIRVLIASLVALGVTILCAAVSYHFLEKPFLRLKKRFTTVQSRPV